LRRAAAARVTEMELAPPLDKIVPLEYHVCSSARS
jgi:hypothetical protein